MDRFFTDDHGRLRWLRVIAAGLGGMLLVGALALLFGWVVMLLWNWLMPEIFKLPTISYWQAWGLVVLAHILIKPGFTNTGNNQKRHVHRHVPAKPVDQGHDQAVSGGSDDTAQ
ncbi:MAG: hypothetical protein JW923_12430 [Spirochaetales bacterium]|nr:hypothetical protein [Spirochaetales bacterium]